jgi:hypothetical protein
MIVSASRHCRREGPHVDRTRSDAGDLPHRLGAVFRNVQRKAAVLRPVVQRAELNKKVEICGC